MARRTQLLALVAQLRAETGRNQSVTVGVAELDNLKEMLRRVQEQLYDDYPWPHLRVQRTVALLQSGRYYDFPTDLNMDRIERVALKYSGQYVEIERGIEFGDYTIYDSNAATESTPARKWDIRFTDTTEQIEIWPIPNSDDQTLYLFGTKSLSTLVEESDRADLDDRLIVLYAAAEMLARQGSKDAKAKLEQANARLMTLRRNSMNNTKTIQMGLGNWRKTDKNRINITVS